MSDEDFGRYQVSEEIGRGAMGVVYRGEDPLIGREVAIKAINRAFLASMDVGAEEFLERFRREAQVAGGMSHPNIVKVFDLGPSYMVMEYVEGETLAALIKREGALPPSRALHLLVQVGEALDYAHRQGVVHRDVKPGNVMVESGDHVKVMDFGLARIATSNLTAAGAVLGSASYMAPEVIQGRPADPRSDIFSLGVLAYETLTGSRPFAGKSVSIIITKIVRDPPRPAHELNLPPEFDAVFARALAKEPDERYASARELSQALATAGRFAVGSSGRGPAAGTPAAGDASMVVVDAAELGDLLHQDGGAAPGEEPAESDAGLETVIQSDADEIASAAPGPAEATMFVADADLPGPDQGSEATLYMADAAPDGRPGRDARDSTFVIRDKAEMAAFIEQMRSGVPPPAETGSAPPTGADTARRTGTSRVALAVAAGVAALLLAVGIAWALWHGPAPAPSATAPADSGAHTTLPEKISGAAPILPADLSSVTLPANVLVEFEVTTAGAVVAPRVVESGGTLLDTAALDAVRSWRYTPATRGGTPVSVTQRARFKFEKP